MSETATQRLKAFKMPFDSMEPAITTGSEVIGDVLHYTKNEPKRWDIVVFSSAAGPGQFIKRIIGLPGETIHFTHEGLKVDGSVVPAPSELKNSFSSFKQHSRHKFGTGEFKIPEDSVFVIGDNPEIYVADSREHGPVPVRNLEARVFAAVRITLL